MTGVQTCALPISRLEAQGISTEVLAGARALCDLAAHPEVDSVMAAIVGAAGLTPCLAAAHAGKRLLLANKEALVVGGALFMNAVHEGGARLQTHGVATEVLAGPQALCDLAAHPEVDAVMAAIVGAAGLAPCLAAARAGKRLLLANKEALVVGGALFMAAVREGGATLLPIDSEHSAIFQSLPQDPATWEARVDKIILTASLSP